MAPDLRSTSRPSACTGGAAPSGPSITKRCGRRRVSRGAVLAGVMALAVAFVPAAAPVAHATPLGLGVCLERDQNTYDPGLSSTPRKTQISSTGTLNPCGSLTDPTLTSGTYEGSGTGTVSCTGGTFEGTVTYHWNNGRQSTISYTAVIGTRLLGETVVVYKGTVTAGEFVGFDYTSPLTALNLSPLDCLNPQGLTSTAGPTISLFTPTEK